MVLLEGPEPVATRGLALLGVARQYLGIATELSQRRGAVTGDGADIDGFRQRVEALMPAYGEAANTFIREARQALDELLVVD